MRKTSLAPTVRFSVIQGAYWAGFCPILAYAAVFLLSRGFSNSAVGLIIAAGGALSALLQPVIGAYADRQKKMILRPSLLLMAAGTVLFAALLLLSGSGWITAVLYALLVALIRLIMPFSYSIGTFYIERGVDIRFGPARAIGSLSYAAISAILGVWTVSHGSGSVILTALVFYVLFAVAVLLFRFPGVPEINAVSERRRENVSLFAFLKANKRYAAVLAGTVCAFISHNMLGSFFYQIVAYRGCSEEVMGYALSLSATLELIPLFLLTRLKKRFGPSFLMKVAFVFMFLRIFGVYLARSATGIYCAMLFQTLGFGLFCGISVYYAAAVSSEEDRVRSQALITAAETWGAVVGSLLGGRILDLTSVPVLLLSACAFALAGALLTCFFADIRKD